MIKITVDSKTHIEAASSDQIKTALTLNNPLYVDAKRQGRYCKNIDEYLHYFKETDAGLTFPRGATGTAMKILENL